MRYILRHRVVSASSCVAFSVGGEGVCGREGWSVKDSAGRASNDGVGSGRTEFSTLGDDAIFNGCAAGESTLQQSPRLKRFLSLPKDDRKR